MLRTCSRFVAVLLATGFFIGISGCKGGGETGAGAASGGVSGTGGGASGGASGGAIGSGGTSGPAPGSGGNAGGGTGGGAGTSGETCDQAPTPRRAGGTIFALPVETVYDGMPFVFGEPNQITGATVTPLNLRFYVSHVELIAAGGASVPADIVTANGAPAPYGLFLYNADDPEAQTLRVLAPEGSYVGMKLALGMSAACNSGSAGGRSFPLSADSEMTWEHLMGYLFLRYEARVTAGAPDGGTSSPPQAPDIIHMGADIANLGTTTALAVRVDGTFSIPASTAGAGLGPVERRLQLAMDQVFKGATADVDLTGVPFATQPDIAAGERLRRTGPDLPLMVFGP